MPKKNTYHFNIDNIDVDVIHKKYGIKDSFMDELPLLGGNKNTNTITYLDQSKNTHICKVNAVDIKNKKYLNCFWDTFPIGNEVMPIGCPIKYVPSVGIKDYISSISKNRYIIREYLTTFLKRNVDKLENNDYYITDKAFCSLNCTLSYIEKNKSNPLYKNSKMLLYKMVKDMYSTEYGIEDSVEHGTEHEISPAGDKDLIIEYGGDITIEKFREGFDNIEYINQGILQTRPIIRIFEEKFKL